MNIKNLSGEYPQKISETRNRGILVTGLRLLAILQILQKGEVAKNEIADFITKEFCIKEFSKETLKLDINTLIASGFEIKRKGSGEGFRYLLNKKILFRKFNKEETEILGLIKEAALELSDYKQILFVKSFFEDIRECFPCDFSSEILDFGFYNRVNPIIVKKIETLIKDKKCCKIIYDSPSKGKREIGGIPDKIVKRNGKLYLNCYAKKYDGKITLRVDNIMSVEETDKIPEFEILYEKPVRYTVKKDYLENHPLLESEKIIKTGGKRVEIESDEEDEFFIIQRILSLGTNCLKIDNDKIKSKAAYYLKKTLENYR